MPRPEQTPPSLYKGLPYGANAVTNQQAQDIPDPTDPTYDEFSDMQPPSEGEQFLYSPTDRPKEPITSGMSFGQGPNAPKPIVRDETPNQFAVRVAQTLSAEGESSPGLQKFIKRIERGL